MNASHLHLILNHIPILGVLFGILVLGGGIVFKSKAVQVTALVTFVVTALITFPVVKTGDEAEHSVEHLAGMSEDLIEEHEELAETGLWLTAVLGLASLIGLAGIKKDIFPKLISMIVLILAIPVFIWMIRVGNSGGNIRHPEIKEGIAEEKH